MLNDNLETWKDIPGYETYYQASTLGRIKSLSRKSARGFLLKEKIIKGSPNTDGYLQLRLYKEGVKTVYRVHRLIALTFIPNTENKPRINHRDNDRTNNMLINLEWATHQEDIDHKCKQNRQNRWKTHKHPMLGKKGEAHQNYGKSYNKGAAHPQARVVLDLQTGIYYDTCAEAADAKGHNRGTLYNKLLGNRPNKTSLIYV